MRMSVLIYILICALFRVVRVDVLETKVASTSFVSRTVA